MPMGRDKKGRFILGWEHPMKNKTTRLNTCPCGIKFVCVTHPAKRGRPVYQRVKYHSEECRRIYSKNLRGGESSWPQQAVEKSMF